MEGGAFGEVREKLMDEKWMKDFHEMVLDMDYWKELLEEVEQICGRRTEYGAVCVVPV